MTGTSIKRPRALITGRQTTHPNGIIHDATENNIICNIPNGRTRSYVNNVTNGINDRQVRQQHSGQYGELTNSRMKRRSNISVKKFRKTNISVRKIYISNENSIIRRRYSRRF